MRSKNTPDETTDMIRQSILETSAKKQKDKYCVRDFSGDVFELTTDMLVKEHYFNKEETTDLAGVAECILRKYEKLLSVK